MKRHLVWDLEEAGASEGKNILRRASESRGNIVPGVERELSGWNEEKRGEWFLMRLQNSGADHVRPWEHAREFDHLTTWLTNMKHCSLIKQSDVGLTLLCFYCNSRGQGSQTSTSWCLYQKRAVGPAIHSGAYSLQPFIQSWTRRCCVNAQVTVCMWWTSKIYPAPKGVCVRAYDCYSVSKRRTSLPPPTGNLKVAQHWHLVLAWGLRLYKVREEAPGTSPCCNVVRLGVWKCEQVHKCAPMHVHTHTHTHTHTTHTVCL